jgi:predicted nucleic acid-binding protein
MMAAMRIPTRKPRTYIDSSVFGGIYDREFQEHSEQFFDAVRRGQFVPYLSPVVHREIERAPDRVRAFYDHIEPLCRRVGVTGEALDLRDAYLEAEVVPARYSDDALHVALAVINRLDVVVSWNFRHLVNFQRSRAFNVASFVVGYPAIEIRTPREVLNEDEDI